VFLLLETATPGLDMGTLFLLTQHLAVVAQADDACPDLRNQLSMSELTTVGKAVLCNSVGLQCPNIK
jgi:hypothetical protein